MNASETERLFDKAWAQVVVDRTVSILREEFGEPGCLDYFDSLIQMVMSNKDEEPAYAELSAKFARPEEAVRKDVSRLRQQYAERLRCQIRETLPEGADVEEELRCLLSCL